MKYLSLHYAIFVAALLFVYYLLSFIKKGRFQWMALLLGSVLFYYLCADGILTLVIFMVPVGASWLGALLLEKVRDSAGKRKAILWGSILLTVLPLLYFKVRGFLPGDGEAVLGTLAVPVGLSFYTLQLIAYITDCYREKIRAQRNPLKRLLCASFFPQVIQGPIPRYREVGEQLFSGHAFEYENMSRGALRVVWGFFLKLMIADKAAVFVNRVYDGDGQYVGGYILVAAVLYALQLYTDFYACTSISLGVAELFGIRLSGNFRRPYLAVSVKDFWRRWHISLTTWLRDYIYIPLGGSRKGKLRTYINILLVFLVSGFWHGNGMHFIVWGLLHAVFQIAGDVTMPARDRIYAGLKIEKESMTWKLLKRFGVFFWVTVGWVFFRAADVSTALRLFRDLFAFRNPWTVFGQELFALGLDAREFLILLISVAVLVIAGWRQERGVRLQEWFVKQHLLLRWGILILAIVVFWVFGTYGYGFDAQDFIYGGF